MNKQNLTEHYYSVLNEGFWGGLKNLASRLGPLGGLLTGGLAGYGISEFMDSLREVDSQVSADFKGSQRGDYFNQPFTSSGGSSGRRGTLEPTSYYSGGMKRGLDKTEAVALADAAMKSEGDRRTAQLGTTGRTRAAARNIMKGRIADLKRKAQGNDGQFNLDRLTPEERQRYESLTGQYKQMDPGSFKMQMQPRSNPVATRFGRMLQRGVDPFKNPRSADEAQLARDAGYDIDAEDRELAAQGRSFTGYSDRGEMYDAFGRRGFALGRGYNTAEETENRATEQTLKSQGYSVNPRGKSQDQIKDEMKKQLEDKMKSQEEKLKSNYEQELRKKNPLNKIFGTQESDYEESEELLKNAAEKTFK